MYKTSTIGKTYIEGEAECTGPLLNGRSASLVLFSQYDLLDNQCASEVYAK